jgi:hypothetical protein
VTPRQQITDGARALIVQNRDGLLALLQQVEVPGCDIVAQRVAELTDSYHERIAIVLEAGDIGEAEARRIAEAEIGRRFVEAFVSGEVAA